jgi:hypothetical protein
MAELLQWAPVYLSMKDTTQLTLKDRYTGDRIFLTLREGIVVGALGSSPKRYVGLTEAAARHKARYAQK